MNFRRFDSVRALIAITIAMSSAWMAQATETTPEDASIRQVLMATFDKPEARLVVDPVVVVGAHAVAGWVQGERGGRALLERRGTEWRLALCAGDGLKEAKVLRAAGIADAVAHMLAEGVATAEARLTAAQRAKFSTFDGMVRIDATGQYPAERKR